MKKSILNNNAHSIEFDGIKFKSEYEKEVYSLFTNAGINIEYEPTKISLTGSFQLDNTILFTPFFDSMGHKKGFGIETKRIKDWTYTPDFRIVHPTKPITYYIECKGQITPDFQHKWKRFLDILHNDINYNYVVFLIQRKGEAKKCLEYIKQDLDDEE